MSKPVIALIAAFAMLRWTSMTAVASAHFDRGVSFACSDDLMNLSTPWIGRVHAAAPEPLFDSPVEHLLWSFGSGSDGQYPQANLIADASGAFFGATATGGQFGQGTVFKLTRSGKSFTEQVLWNFGTSPYDGSNPVAGLIEDASGALYGTTFVGGAYGYGTVFKLTPGGGAYTEQILHSFGNGSDGVNPYGSLLADSTGALYSTTIYGGKYSLGTVFKLTPSGSTYREQLLWSFKGKPDGWVPYSGVIAGKHGVIYGTTHSGGVYDGGTVYSLTPAGKGYKEHIVWSFGGAGDGACLFAPLVMHRGVLYGLTYYQGLYGSGTAFSLNPSAPRATERVIWSFGNGQDGSYPANGALIADATGTLYGTTINGGADGYGSVFALAPSGSGFAERVIFSFHGLDGNAPTASLVQRPSGTLFGTTLTGGQFGYGTAFSVRP